jgi:hypothetical protein
VISYCRENRGGVREAFENLERTSREMGLLTNEGKTKYMEVTRPEGQKVFQVMNHAFELVNDFKYLGTLVTNSSQMTAEINHGIRIANRRCHGLKDSLKSR